MLWAPARGLGEEHSYLLVVKSETVPGTIEPRAQRARDDVLQPVTSVIACHWTLRPAGQEDDNISQSFFDENNSGSCCTTLYTAHRNRFFLNRELH